MVPRAKLGTQGETDFQASEESTDLLALLGPPEPWESQARMASLA